MPLPSRETDVEQGNRTYVSTCSTHHTVNNGSPSRNETRTRSDSDQSRNHTGAETNSRPLSLKTIIQHTPSNTTHASGQVGHHSSHNRTHVSSKCRSSIESEPTNPQEDGTDDNVCNVVRTVVELVGSVSATLSEHDGVGESCASGGDVDGGSTCKIETTHFEDPAGGVPGPAGDGIVDDGGPDEHEDDTGEHATWDLLN